MLYHMKLALMMRSFLQTPRIKHTAYKRTQPVTQGASNQLKCLGRQMKLKRFSQIQNCNCNKCSTLKGRKIIEKENAMIQF